MDLKCTWKAAPHGKISHRFYSLHFDWPVPAAAKRLKVLYIGPKLTKA